MSVLEADAYCSRFLVIREPTNQLDRKIGMANKEKHTRFIHVLNSNFSCGECVLNSLCFPMSLSNQDTEELNKIVKRNKLYRKNQRLCEPGEPFKSVYAVLTGSLKAYNVDKDGEEHVISFYLPGEVYGFSAIERGSHGCIIEALETCAICELPFNQLEKLAKQIPPLQGRLYRMLSHQIIEDQLLQRLLTKNTAEERLGAFLLNLSNRYHRRHLEADGFRLVMSRRDIANHLGVAVETISRIFSKFQREKILSVDQQNIKILDRRRLCGIAHVDAKSA